MKNFITGVALVFLLACSSIVNVAAATVDTLGGSSTPPWAFGSFGEGAVSAITSTVGQTFKLNSGDDTVLNSIKFFLKDYNDADFIDFAAYVYEWDGNKATGSNLFYSSILTTTLTGSYDIGGYDDWEYFIVNTGSLLLEENKEYVFFLSASSFFDGSVGTGRIGLTPAASYANGTFVRATNFNDFSKLFTEDWTVETYADLAFTMEFSSVPVPTTILLLGSGLLCLAGVSRRKN